MTHLTGGTNPKAISAPLHIAQKGLSLRKGVYCFRAGSPGVHSDPIHRALFCYPFERTGSKTMVKKLFVTREDPGQLEVTCYGGFRLWDEIVRCIDRNLHLNLIKSEGYPWRA